MVGNAILLISFNHQNMSKLSFAVTGQEQVVGGMEPSGQLWLWNLSSGFQRLFAHFRHTARLRAKPSPPQARVLPHTCSCSRAASEEHDGERGMQSLRLEPSSRLGHLPAALALPKGHGQMWFLWKLTWSPCLGDPCLDFLP